MTHATTRTAASGMITSAPVAFMDTTPNTCAEIASSGSVREQQVQPDPGEGPW